MEKEKDMTLLKARSYRSALVLQEIMAYSTGVGHPVRNLRSTDAPDETQQHGSRHRIVLHAFRAARHLRPGTQGAEVAPRLLAGTTRRLEDATEEYRTDTHRTVHQCPAGDAGQLHRADSCRHTLPGQPEGAARNAHRRPLRNALLHDGADLLHLRADGFRTILCQPAAVGALLLCVWLHTGTRGKAEEPAEPDSVKTYNDRL